MKSTFKKAILLALVKSTKIKEVDFDPSLDDSYLTNEGKDLRKSNIEHAPIPDSADELQNSIPTCLIEIEDHIFNFEPLSL